jgi:hypothetical protein
VGRSLQEGPHSRHPNLVGRRPEEGRLEAPSRLEERRPVVRPLEVLQEGRPLHPADARPEAPNLQEVHRPGEAPNLRVVRHPADRSHREVVPSPTSRGAGPG